MRLASYELDGRTRIGVVRDDLVFDIPSASSVQDLIEKGKLGEATRVLSTKGIEIEKVRLKAPLVHPDKILMAAVNYKAHGSEQKTPPPKEPYFFTKFGSCIIGPGAPIIIPRISTMADWEVELAVVIGRKCKHVKKENALEYVAGYTVANDVSFRDLQIPEGWPTKLSPLGQNWVMGKALDSALPLGPWLVTGEDIGDPQGLSLSLTVNGIERQAASTEDMIFSVSELIEYLSNGFTLLPGDMISTGTPAGVARFSGAPYLKDGDVVEATVEKIGTLSNPVKSEK
jgi:2-keto-4-pentenoate hydratase/2-oxohepta-3-ene-1,7-dioic acid hydratase in catechol pathway